MQKLNKKCTIIIILITNNLILDVILIKLQALQTICISASMTTNAKHKEILITRMLFL